MKIRLQHVNSVLSIDRAGGWTGEVSEAIEFRLASDAVDFCKGKNLKDVEIVMIFDDPPSECHVPIERVSVSSYGGNLFG